MFSNRFTIVNVLTSVLYTAFISYMFWPVCQNGYCASILVNPLNAQDPLSALILLPLFMIPFLYSLWGLIKYMMGYGFSLKIDKFVLKPSKKEKDYLLLTTLPGLILGLWLTVLMIWSTSLILKF